MVLCPPDIITFSKYMDRVYLLHSVLGYYRMQIRSKKWCHKIMFYMFDLVCVSVWILWHKQNKNEHMPLMGFKIIVADALRRARKTLECKRGWPSNGIQQKLNSKQRKEPAAEVLQDGVHHFPIWHHTWGWCKFPNCKEKTFVACEKCEVILYLNQDKNCFKLFHTL